MSHHESWMPAPEHPQLDGDDVHVWRIAIRDDAPGAVALLNDDEAKRARRIQVASARQRFVASRSAVRCILAAYLGQRPRDLVFCEGPHGKPHLSGAALSFNLSHAGDEALLAVTRRFPVGVDIERVASARMTEEIAARFFSTREQAQLAAFAGEERIAAFFRIWSRKEAVIKALGEGLACPLHSFDVSADAADARLLAFRRAGVEVARWTMRNIRVAGGYAAALAVTGVAGTTHFFSGDR